MAKVPTIYDIGNFSLDWNNAEVLTGSDRPLNVCRQANKDGVAFVYAHKDESSAGCTLYVFKENQTNISDALANVSNGILPCIGCGGTFPIGGTELSIIVKKDEWWCIVTNANPQIKCVYFVPFTYPAVQAQPGCVSYVVETGHNLDNTAFYRKYSDGYIEQWGEVYKTQNGTIDFVIPFVFPHLPADAILNGETRRISGLNIQVQVYDATGVIDVCEVGNVTRTGFDVLNSTAGASNAYGIMWKACGY